MVGLSSLSFFNLCVCLCIDFCVMCCLCLQHFVLFFSFGIQSNSHLSSRAGGVGATQ